MNGKEILMLRMETGSASSSASSPPRSVVAMVRNLKHDVKALQDQVEAIDTEGNMRLENVDKDLVYLRKKISREVRRFENAVIGLIAELEIKVDKLALKVVKHEVAPNPGSSSNFDGKFNLEIWTVFCVALLCLLSFTPEGLLETSFTWSLGSKTKNMAEALALW